MKRTLRFPLSAIVLLSLLVATAAGAAQSPFNGTPFQVPVLIEAEQYDLGGSGVAYFDTTPGNVWNLYRSDDVDIGPFSNGGLHIGNLAAGEWVEYTINVPSTGHYDIRLRYASDYTGTTRFHVRLDGVDVTGAQSLTSTGGWQTYVIKTLSNVPLTGGNNKILRISFDTGFWNLDKLDINPSACTPPSVVTHPASPTVEPTRPASLSVTATGSGPLSYQWYHRGSPISGATSSSLYIPNVQADQTGFYFARVSSSCGSADSNQAEVLMTCDPGELTDSLRHSMIGLTRACNWQGEYKRYWPISMGGGSYNKPVLAAAVALLEDPGMPGPENTASSDVWDWWTMYLEGELGLRGSAWAFGGKEPFSHIYHHNNITAIMAVNYEAKRRNRTDVRNLARQWLRANFALMAAAATDKPQTFWDRGTFTQYNDGYSGPWVATAGMRTLKGSWGYPARNILFARAVGLSTNAWEIFTYQDRIRIVLEGRDNQWDVASEGDIYGLTTSEKTDLAGIKGSNQLPGDFWTWISGIHTIEPYHILGWPGVRATLMESNRHFSTAPTYGIAYFASSGRAEFLYPWDPANGRRCLGGRDGVGTLAPDLTWMEVWNEPAPTSGTCAGVHPEQTVRIDGLPGGTPSYHIEL